MLSLSPKEKGWDEAIPYCTHVILVEIVDLLAIRGNYTN